MPLSEFDKMARGSFESAQQRTNTTSSADLSHLPGNELVELVWNNGQIVMQGQSSRARKTSSSTDFLCQTSKVQDKDRLNANHSKMGKFGVMDRALNDFASAVPSGEMGFDQDDDLVPWLNYHLDESVPDDYCSDILPELPGVTGNQISSHSSIFSSNKRGSYNQTTRGSNFVQNDLGVEGENVAKVSSSEVGEGSGARISHFFPWSFQENQTSLPSLKSGVSSIISNNITNTKHAVCGDPSTGVKIQKQDSVFPNTNSGIMNFSHFSRPAALVHANLRNVGAIATPVTLGEVGMRGKNKGPTRIGTNFAESTLINSSSGLGKEMDSNSQPNSVPPKVDSIVVGKLTEEFHAAEQSEAVCRNDVKNDELLNQVAGEKTVEPVAGSSSLCSGNSAERASNDLTHNLKRKCHETDDSDGRSEDIEEESVGIRKAAPVRRGAGSKRSRAAEVHNLSERRRRDRINEKMRALQELIPNCNKVDKASMLDEAIEYLKTLQLQVQMMSMGAGMYMPPMMFPAGMAQLHAAHIARFSPMGMGFGMGMMDMNGGSTGCPMMQVPPLHGAHFPAPRSAPLFAPNSFQGMAGPNFQVFGHPAPHVPFSGVPLINSARLNAPRMAAPMELPISAPSSNSKDLMPNANSQMMRNANASTSINHTSSQCPVSNAGFGQSSLLQRSDEARDDVCHDDMNLTKDADILLRPGYE